MTDPDRRERSRRPPPVRKSLGQHFLTDRRILQRIVDALDLSGTETVIEIGPGRGSLTELLAPRARRLILIEYDRALAADLRARYAATPSVTIVEADVLKVNLGELASGPYSLIGNVPYYITTPILFHAMTPPRPDRAVYLVQREVAERIVAAPNSEAYGALSVNVRVLATPTLLFRVAPGSFQPPPKVEGAVVRIDPLAKPLVMPEEEAPFSRFVREAFGMRRKQLRRVIRSLWNLSAEQAEMLLGRCAIDPASRPETLSPDDFMRLLREKRRA
jgi:16S rRNA (adenine1518-N6/adenine1519-N6)-dimethyltransferase